MNTYKIPVDFTIKATNADQAAHMADLFLKACHRDVAIFYNVVDYELPVGYPIESTSP